MSEIRAILYLLYIYSLLSLACSMKNVIDRYGKAKEEPQQVTMNPNSELMVCELN